jgi:hypothetical protein
VVAEQVACPAFRHQGFKEALDKLTPIRFAPKQADRRGRETRR